MEITIGQSQTLLLSTQKQTVFYPSCQSELCGPAHRFLHPMTRHASSKQLLVLSFWTKTPGNYTCCCKWPGEPNMWAHCPAVAQEGAGLSTQQQRGGGGEAVLLVASRAFPWVMAVYLLRVWALFPRRITDSKNSAAIPKGQAVFSPKILSANLERSPCTHPPQ